MVLVAQVCFVSGFFCCSCPTGLSARAYLSCVGTLRERVARSLRQWVYILAVAPRVQSYVHVAVCAPLHSGHMSVAVEYVPWYALGPSIMSFRSVRCVLRILRRDGLYAPCPSS